MPGIFGLIRREPAPVEQNEALLRRMERVLRHSSTYRAQWHADGRSALALTAPGSCQDAGLVWDPARTTCLAVAGTCSFAGPAGEKNGRAAPRALLRRWIGAGREMAAGLRGEFEIGILDREVPRITIIVGPFGLRRLYFARAPGITLFAPEVKAVLACGLVERAIDEAAVGDLMSLSYVLGERTLFRSISRVPPGTMLEITPEGVEARHYVTIDYRGGEDAAGGEADREGDAVDEVVRLLRQSTARQLAGARRVGVSLSGGLDSRLVLALAREKTESVGAWTFGTYRNEERRIAQRVADAAGTEDYAWIPLQADRLPEEFSQAVWMTDGMIEATCGRTIGSIRQQARRRDMLLVGLYGESILGGDKFGPEDVRADLSHEEELAGIEQGLGLHYNAPLWRHVFDAEVAQSLDAHARADVAIEYGRSRRVSPLYSDRKDHFFLMQRARRYLGEACLEGFFLPDGFLFFDYELVQYLFSLPPELRTRHRLYAQVFARAFPALAAIPWQRTGVPVFARAPRTRRWRRSAAALLREWTRKASMGGIDLPNPARATDFDRWYRVSQLFRQFVRDTLLDPGAVCRPWYSPGGAERLLRWQDAGKNYSFLISRLLTLELYWRELRRHGLDTEASPRETMRVLRAE
jgi:asparagine synthase (glutamine-hydrolysing)